MYSVSIETNIHFQINGSVEQLTYRGIYNPSCLFGGLVVAKTFNKNYKESLTMCDKAEKKIRRFYSQSSSLIVVVYWHKGYSEIQISVRFSQTKCKSVLFDPCMYKIFCLYNLCHEYTLKITKNSDISFVNSQMHAVYFTFRKGECVVIQLLSTKSQKGNFFDNAVYLQCFLELSPATSKDTIIEIKGLLKNLPTDKIIESNETKLQALAKETFINIDGLNIPNNFRENDPESLTIKSAEFCSASSSTYCIRNEFGFKVPRYIMNLMQGHAKNVTRKSRILIQFGIHKSIIPVDYKVRLFSTSWIDITVKKNTNNSPYKSITELGEVLTSNLFKNMMSAVWRKGSTNYQYIFMLKVRDNNVSNNMLRKVVLQVVMAHHIRPKCNLLNWNQKDYKRPSKNFIIYGGLLWSS